MSTNNINLHTLKKYFKEWQDSPLNNIFIVSSDKGWILGRLYNIDWQDLIVTFQNSYLNEDQSNLDIHMLSINSIEVIDRECSKFYKII